MNSYLPLVIIFTGGTILTLGDIVMKKWVSGNNIWVFIFGLLIYLIGLVFLAFSFKYKNIAVASVMFVIFNVITLSAVSRFFYKETLSGYQLVGIFLGLLAIAFLELA